MANPTITLINAGGLTDGVINNADSSTGWSNLTSTDTDLKVQGTASVVGVTRNNGEDSYYDDGGAPVTAVGKVLRGWVNTTNLAYMQPEATNPYELWCYDSSSQSNGLALFGSDTYPGGWFYFWQDMDDFTGVTLANVDRWGIEAGHGSNAKNVPNMWMDVLRYMDGYYMTGGTSGDKVTIATTASTDATSAYGIVQESYGVYFGTGTIQIGNGSTTTYFEMDSEVLVFRGMPGALSITAGLYEISATGSGCDVVIKSSVLRANGSTDDTRYVLDFSDSNASVEFTDNLVTRAGAIDFYSGMTATGNTFDDCDQITHAGATMNNSAVNNYEGTADTAALVYNVAADPNGEMDDMTFTKGTAATHAIELGTSSPTTVTLDGVVFSGYNASNGQNDSAILVSRTSGTVTINISGGGTTPTYKSAGATVVISSSISVTVTVNDSAGNAIPGVQVAIFQDDATRTTVLSSTATDEDGEVSTSASAGLGDIIIRARQSTEIANFDTSSVNTSTEVITTSSNHNFHDGDAVVYDKDGGTDAIGLTEGTTYYVNSIAVTTLSLHTSAANAISDTARVNITATGTETHQLDPVRYIATSANGTIGTTAFSAQITMPTDEIATG